ncbi:GNAT family N-acetyltransferase [Shewanella sp. VB17]|uniref:GNAT family N-acetyltransferase n=1 Tax=Shewanella sp. VB17 TaxID=2739432 RepID=UPI0015630491|nr:GNAT family N-acetyltransferase [Shewanella sp. VB17]NRD72631.1 GNAT family N-acetyltransferase [Shewanella sp. VB17]
MGTQLTIRLLTEQDLPKFFDYLIEQLAESGQGEVPLFQPLSRDNPEVTVEMKRRFSQGIATDFGQTGWRKIWGALDQDEHLLGHIDLRGHGEAHTEHRALLGMGVHTRARRTGLGKRFIQVAQAWAMQEAALVWIDLWVLSNNKPAIGLYEATGFNKLGEIEDMFRIDAESHSFTRMAKNLRA